jgi:hypothetical protein
MYEGKTIGLIDDQLQSSMFLLKFMERKLPGIELYADRSGQEFMRRNKSVDVAIVDGAFLNPDNTLQEMQGLDIIAMLKKTSPSTKCYLWSSSPEIREAAVSVHNIEAFDKTEYFPLIDSIAKYFNS